VREPVWLDAAMLRAIQYKLIQDFGGIPGIRDENLLDSALARPKNLLAYGEPTLFALAAAYAYGIARNHPFLDGNKRAALAAADVFLQLNGYELTAPEPEALVTFLALAAGELSEAALADWIQRNTAVLPGS
jgi:death on curing protein